MSFSLECHQVNLQAGFGGGEVYTVAFVKALARLGIRSTLYVNAKSQAWQRFDLPTGTSVVCLDSAENLPAVLIGKEPAWVVCHTLPMPSIVAALRARRHYVTAFVHMPLFDRAAEPLRPFDLLYPVSSYVKSTLLNKGLIQTYADPLYGVALLERHTGNGDSSTIQRNSCYDWDKRKVRERLLSYVEPAWEVFRPRKPFSKRSGLTLGIVSRLTPIKQFPLLLSLLSPVLMRYPEVYLEIFGAGGFASVRDMRKAVQPIASQVRFWGEQRNVTAVYGQLDGLLTGLPEKEALGLNVIEAQSLEVPVLAPDAPPFDETVMHGVTGLRYKDPRVDGGESFEQVLGLLRNRRFRFDSSGAVAHLEQFSLNAFEERCNKLVRMIESQIFGNGA